MGYMEIAFNSFMENTLYGLICQQAMVESSNGRMTVCKYLSYQFNQNLVTATRSSQLMACSELGFGVVENCVNFISLTSLLTVLCRIKRNMPESVGGNSGSHTEGGDPHLGPFFF